MENNGTLLHQGIKFNLMWGGGTLLAFSNPKIHFSSPRFKLSNPGGRGCDLHGLLTASHHHLNHTKSSQVSEEMQFAFGKY